MTIHLVDEGLDSGPIIAQARFVATKYKDIDGLITKVHSIEHKLNPMIIKMIVEGEINLNELNGKIIVINFWASWCEPCKEEASDLEQIWLNYKSRDVILLGIGYADTKVEALDYLRTWNITYPNGPDIGTKISRLFRIRGVPETYIVSKDGYIIESFVGPVTYKTLTTILNKLLQ